MENSGPMMFDSIVPLGRGYFAHDSRHFCLDTISLSLRDKSHSPIEAPRIRLVSFGTTGNLAPRSASQHS